jgi:hypothetical protein
MCRQVHPIKYAIVTVLDRLVPSFCRILVLLVGLTLPIFDEECAKDIHNFVAYKRLTTVTDKLMGSAMLDDIFLQHVNKLTVIFNTIHISDLGGNTNKADSSSRSIINGWDI